MKRTLFAVGVSLLIAGQSGAQNGGWFELGPWELVERLDDVQIAKVFRASELSPMFFPPKPTWRPEGSDFFPADQLLYYRWATQGQYYAFDSEGRIALDDVQIEPYLDSSGSGRFRISRVEIMVYFPRIGRYTIQGFWTGADGDFPPYPSFAPPATFLRGNQGPHTLNVTQAGVWRLGTVADPFNEVFTVQSGQMSSDFGNRYVFYLGLLISSPAAWVCGNLPGDPNFDYFIMYEPENQEDVYQYYGLEGGVQATFGLRFWGDVAGTQLQGTIAINGYTGSYEGKQATIRVKQGTTINTYTATLGVNGSYSLRVNETGDAEVLAQVAPGLAKKVSLNLSGTVNQNFTLTNGDVNGDNRVDDADLLEVLFNFGCNGFGCTGDVTGDSLTDDADLLIVLFNFGSVGDGL